MLDERVKYVSRTENGIEVMIAGLLLSWIPYILYLGYLLMFIGLILITLGRIPFRERHGIFVGAAWVFFIAYVIGTIGLAVALVPSVAGIGSSVPKFESLMSNFMIAAIAIGVLAGISQILLVIGLTKKYGALVLILGLASQIIISLYVYYIFIPLVDQAVSANNLSRVRSIVSGNLSYQFRLLNAVPPIIFSIGYYLVRKRIASGEIPEEFGKEAESA